MIRVLEYTGRPFIYIFEELGRILTFLIDAITWMVRPPFRLRLVFKQMESVGVQSIFVVLITAVFTGMVLALQTYYGFRMFGGEGLVGATVALSMTREIGPVFTGLMVTARAGSAMFLTYLDYRGEYLFESNRVKSFFTLRIQPREDKYYLLQVVDNPRGKETVTKTIRTVDGVTSTEKKVESESSDLLFSVQIAKRYYDIGFRAGLFESTGGAGIDYHLFKDRLKLSFEAFDFDIKTLLRSVTFSARTD